MFQQAHFAKPQPHKLFEKHHALLSILNGRFFLSIVNLDIAIHMHRPRMLLKVIIILIILDLSLLCFQNENEKLQESRIITIFLLPLLT